jgi:hypothetical protein
LSALVVAADGADRPGSVAVMIVGLVIVFNSALFTENIDKGGSAQSARDSAEFASELQRNSRSMALRVNHARKYSGPSEAVIDNELRGGMVNNTTAYAEALSSAFVGSESAYVNVSIDPSASTFGYRLVKDREGEFVDPDSGGVNWVPVDDRTDVGWFVVNLNASELSRTDPLVVRMVNESGDSLRVSFRRNANGSVRIRSDASVFPGSDTTVAACWPTRGRLLVDLIRGTVYGRDCSFNATEHLQPAYDEVRFENGSDAEGTYELVVEDRDGLSNDIGPDAPPPKRDRCTSSAPSANECWTKVYWSLEMSVTYRSPRSSYEGTWTVGVYNKTHG